MPASSPSQRTLIRVVIALGLAMLLVVAAWSNSHGETSAGSALCVASGASATSVTTHHDTVTANADADAPASGLLGLCGIVVFLLLLATIRMLCENPVFRIGRGATASAPPRAGPIASVPALTLAQLSLSRT